MVIKNSLAPNNNLSQMYHLRNHSVYLLNIFDKFLLFQGQIE